MFGELHEECGVFGICMPERSDVASACYYALYALQHRGQESCGIAVNDRGVIKNRKDVGLVNDVFTKDALDELGAGKMAIGHVRYGTMGMNPRLNAQPLLVNHIKGCMALAHNGALTNAVSLREELEMTGSIFHSTSDTEVISYIITRERLKAQSIEDAVVNAMDVLQGAYSLVVMSPTKLIAARDPHGFRPLCLGTLQGGYIVASESCALDSIGAAFVRDIEPGEVVVITKDGVRSIDTQMNKCNKTTCIFEYIYFARPDSVIDGSSVHIARQRAGAFLALESPVQADVVIGAPDSGIDAAIGYAKQSGIPYGLGFVKNKYIGRTFIQPVQTERDKLVGIKLNPVAATVAGKRVILVDDSIVRGTTSARVVKLLREAGALEVHMRSSAPPFMNPCYFGTDIDSRDKLIACQHTHEEIREIIGADSLAFLSIENCKRLCDNSTGFCTACFDGEYPVEPPEAHAKWKFETEITEED